MKAKTWTAREESEFKELQSNLELAHKRRAVAVEALAAILNGLYNEDDGICVERAVRRADELRDALAPFDSGIRAVRETE
jgi:hypothetical protein